MIGALITACLLTVGRAHAEAPPELAVTWRMSLGGAEIGTRAVKVRYETGDGDLTRVLEAYTSFSGGTKKKDKFSYAQRLTANSHVGRPASFHSVVSSDGDAQEVQARITEGGWNVTVAHAGTIKTYQLQPARVDLSTIDLFDPEFEGGLATLSHARILSAEIGKILEGPVVPLGPSQATIGGETVTVDGYEWQTEQGPWRFWYATNGFLVRFEVPLLGKRVTAVLDGPPPRMVDEFPVFITPPVDDEDLK